MSDDNENEVTKFVSRDGPNLKDVPFVADDDAAPCKPKAPCAPKKSSGKKAEPKSGGDAGTRFIKPGGGKPQEQVAAGDNDEPAKDAGAAPAGEAWIADDTRPVVGWLVVTGGPGRGASRPVYHGMNSLGRASDQMIPLDLGDETISRDKHCFIIYDEEARKFYVQHGGKANLVRRNTEPVLEATELGAGDDLRVGATTLKFVPFCGPDFDWQEQSE